MVWTGRLPRLRSPVFARSLPSQAALAQAMRPAPENPGPHFHTLDDATVEFFERDSDMAQKRRRVLFKHAIRKRRSHWADVLFIFQDNKSGVWQRPHARFVRYQWVGYRWHQTSVHNLSIDAALTFLPMIRDFVEAQKATPAGKPLPAGVHTKDDASEAVA